MRIESAGMLAVAGLLVAAAVVVAWWRGVRLAPVTAGLLGAGMVCLALACGGISVTRERAGEVVVMVDLSPSTRTAGYRQRAALMRRIDQLLGDRPRRVIAFAQEHAELPDAAQLGDLPAERTRFAPPPAEAVLLFSDARFELPETSSAVFVVVDEALTRVADASVAQLEAQDDAAIATIRNSGAARRLTLSGTGGGAGSGAGDATAVEIPPGGRIVSARIDADAGNGIEVVARLDGGDAWPENDALAVRRAPEMRSERWWIGRSAPDEGWRALAPRQLPQASAAYLAPSIIVLENIAAAELSHAQQQRLAEYVRDLGGGMLIIGGDRAFAAGGYPGSALEMLSPLSSTPPLPTTHWMVLVDQSGSMSGRIGALTRWDRAAEAVVKILPAIPRADIVSAGSFAAELRWWVRGEVAEAAMKRPLPPAELSPHGPTNLEPALRRIIAEADGALPVELLLISDTEARLDEPDALAEALRGRRVRLHVLAIGGERENDALRAVALGSGGQFAEQDDPAQWAQSLRQMLQSAAEQHVSDEAIEVRFLDALQALPARALARWNRLWLKENATALATAAHEGADVALAARWRLGSGEVLAAGFAPAAAELGAMVELVSRPPRDPRFSVSWENRRELRISVDAIEQRRPMNGLSLVLELLDETSGAAQRMTLPQRGPGRYELQLDPPRVPTIATIMHGAAVIERFALAGRYAPEFAELGNDLAAMRELAQRSGGAVIPPDQQDAIEFAGSRREVGLSGVLSILGAALLAVGLVHWRLRG